MSQAITLWEMLCNSILNQESMLYDVFKAGMMLILSACFPPTLLAILLVLFCLILLRPSPRCSKLGSSLSSGPFRPLLDLLILLSLCIRRTMLIPGARGSSFDVQGLLRSAARRPSGRCTFQCWHRSSSVGFFQLHCPPWAWEGVCMC